MGDCPGIAGFHRREAVGTLRHLVASVSHIFRTHQSLPSGVLQGLSESLFEIGSQVGYTGLELTMWLSLAWNY